MAYVSDNDEEFAVYDHDVIGMILLGMAQKNIALNATFNAGADVLLTVVLDVDTRAGLVYLDVNANDEFNRHMLGAKRIHFHAMFNGAKILWTSNGVKDSTYEGTRAFVVEIPERLQRIQRRGAFRVNTPLMNPVICRIKVSPERELVMPLFDICVEGVGLILPATPDAAIQKLTEFKDCKIEHADLGVVPVSLYVKSLWEITLANGSKAPRAGMEFVRITPATQSQIQRFVYKLERANLAQAKGN